MVLLLRSTLVRYYARLCILYAEEISHEWHRPLGRAELTEGPVPVRRNESFSLFRSHFLHMHNPVWSLTVPSRLCYAIGFSGHYEMQCGLAKKLPSLNSATKTERVPFPPALPVYPKYFSSSRRDRSQQSVSIGSGKTPRGR